MRHSMSIEFRQELHRMAQPSNGISPDVIRDMTIEQLCRLARVVAAPNILPLPLRAWAAKRTKVRGRGPTARCPDQTSAPPACAVPLPARRAPASTGAHTDQAVATRGGRATAQAIWMTPAA